MAGMDAAIFSKSSGALASAAVLLLGSGNLGSGSSLSSLDVLAIAQVLHQFDRLTGADDDVPLGQLVLNLALHDSNLARDDEGAVVDLGGDVEFVKELLDGGGGELAWRPMPSERTCRMRR